MRISNPLKSTFRTALTLASVTIYCAVFSQNIQDSIPFIVPNVSVDSILVNEKLLSEKNRLKNSYDSTQINLKEKSLSIRKNIKQELLDSTKKEAYLNRVSTFKDKFQISKPDSSSIDSIKKSFMTKIKSTKIIPSLSGTIISESYATNFLDPFTRSEAVYTRLYGSPSISMLGLPFNVDFYYTTEDNSFYNSNYISLDFDVVRYKEQLRQKAEKKIQDQIKAKKEISKNLFDVTKTQQVIAKKLAAEKAKLEKLQSGVPTFNDLSLDGKLDSLKNQAVTKAKSTVTDSIAKIKTNSLNLAKQQQDRLLDSAQNKMDSSSANSSYQYATDSIEKIKQRVKELEGQYNQAKEQYEKLKYLKENLNDSISSLKSTYANKDFALAKLKKTKYGKKLATIISSVEQFQLGLTNPIFSEYTLNGIPVKGLNTRFKTKSKNFAIVAGRTFTNSFNDFNAQNSQEFDRNVFGLSSRFNLDKVGSKKLTISNVSFFDPIGESEVAKQNILTSIDYESKVFKVVDLKLSLNHSHYEEIRKDKYETVLEENDNDILPSSLDKALDQLAFDIETGIDITKNLDFSLNYKRVNPEYISLGNPFLRYNFQEGEVKAKSKFFKRKVTVTSFYKYFEDNITNLTETTNTMSGYGVSFRTNFRKGLNFQGQYSPYQQGNNNPDTLFRTDNQLSVKTLTAIYNKSLDNITIVSMLTYVNSNMDYNQGEMTVDNSLYLGSVSAIWKKLSVTSSISRNLTGPTIDTLNFWGVRVSAMQTGGEKVNFTINTFYDGFDAGAVRHRTTLQARFKILKKLEATLSGEYGQVKGLYGIDEKNVFGSRLLLKYQL